MDSVRTGRLIYAQRKELNLTQKELAKKLNITDKAVSKWERGISCPDISIIPKVADVLNVSIEELLLGSKNVTDSISAANQRNRIIKKKQKKPCSVRVIIFAAYTLLFLISAFVCVVCDFAVGGSLSWSLYPISALVFVWLISFPFVIYRGGMGVFISLILFTVGIIPFLYSIDRIIGKETLIMPIGIRMSAIGIVFLWCVFLLFKKFGDRKTTAAAISFLISVPLLFVVNISLSGVIGGKVFDVWDGLSALVLVITAVVLFIISGKNSPNK